MGKGLQKKTFTEVISASVGAHNKQMPNVAMSKPPFMAGQVLVNLFFNPSQENSIFPPNHRLPLAKFCP